jgi:pimeloyl-ACP methyl ester carboxylesterase
VARTAAIKTRYGAGAIGFYNSGQLCLEEYYTLAVIGNRLDSTEGWSKFNEHYWRADHEGFLEFFFGHLFTEPHSTKQIEDAVGWGTQTDPQTIARGFDADWPNDKPTAVRLCSKVRCPTVVVQGSQDAVVGPERGAAVAAAIPHARLVTLDGCGHAPHLRDPVVTNRILRDFQREVAARA